MLSAVLLVSLAALARASPNPAATLTAVSPAPTVDVITRPITPCAVVKCTASTTCVVINGRASCRPIKPQQCGPTVCPAGTTCCNALCGICTPPGMMCVQGCKVTPDFPVLTLTPVVRKEEPPVSVEAKCGKNVCGEGEECCNSSCGICVKKGGFCTEQWCGPEEPEVVEPPKATILPVVRKEEPPVSVEAKCGKNVCGEGEECCNSSCGICVKKGGYCTLQYCWEEPEVVEPPKATILPVDPIVGQKCGRNVCGKGQFCCNSSCSQCAPLGGACTMQFCGHDSIA